MTQIHHFSCLFIAFTLTLTFVGCGSSSSTSTSSSSNDIQQFLEENPSVLAEETQLDEADEAEAADLE